MNQEEADQDAADEVSEEVDSRGIFIFISLFHSQHFFFILRCRVVVDNVGDHVMPEQSVFCRPDELGWAYVILQTCTQTVQILLSLSFSCSSPFYFSSYH